MEKIYVIHENNEWTGPLYKRFEELGLPYEDWNLTRGIINLNETPPEGIFYNRMSASSHTRGNRYAPELADAVLAWLDHYGRTVINGSGALNLEVSKVRQYMQLEKYGVKTPETIAAVGKEQLIEAAEEFRDRPFITKHNRAGKGLGVRLFRSPEGLKDYVESDDFDDSVDGITLIQEYVESPEPFITRCEFVGGELMYAVMVDTSDGFELCPADACSVEDLFCPAGTDAGRQPKFQVINGFDEPVIEKYKKVLRDNDIQIAGIEFIRDKDGKIYTYDINTNTNYNSNAEEAARQYGMLEIAKYLGYLLKVDTVTNK
ncbi:ATP-grasp domain-containing protein [Salinicoccus carnicancri]|uniref:ATP-grasp domain-containing protein n=1 Tax=Salinicoccus carnicancri TaxID=558170 RepID=UPI0002F16FF9|nr:hypothetical protein [Salinicoccus carnicancri]